MHDAAASPPGSVDDFGSGGKSSLPFGSSGRKHRTPGDGSNCSPSHIRFETNSSAPAAVRRGVEILLREGKGRVVASEGWAECFTGCGWVSITFLCGVGAYRALFHVLYRGRDHLFREACCFCTLCWSDTKENGPPFSSTDW